MIGTRRENGTPTRTFTDDLHHVASDIADLFELQAELLAKDWPVTVRHLAVPLVLGVVGATVVATASLLAFAAFGLWLHTGAGFGLPAAFLLAAGGAFAFGGLCLGGAYLLVRWWGVPLSRSWRELKRNVAWTRRALFGPSRRKCG